MRMLRSVLAVLAALVLALVLGAAVSAPAGAAQVAKRVIVEEDPKDAQVTFNAFRLKGTITQPLADGTLVPYAEDVVKLQKKTCRTCTWKTVKKLETNERGTFRTRIFAPREGRWKWRVKVPASDGYSTTTGQTWTLYFR